MPSDFYWFVSFKDMDEILNWGADSDALCFEFQLQF